MSLGTLARSLATTFLTRYGEDVVFHERPPAEFHPATDSAVATPIDYPVTAVVSVHIRRERDLADAAEVQIVVPASSLPRAPNPSAWSVTARGKRRELTSPVEIVNAMGIDACYLVTARGP